MKKVLFFIESLSGGGAEKVLSDIVSNIDSKEFDVTVCTVTDQDVYQNKVMKSCKYFSFLKKRDYKAGGLRRVYYWIMLKLIYGFPTKWIYKWFIKDHYDIEVAFVEGFATKFIAASKNHNSKKIAWVHTDMLKNSYADNYYKDINRHKSVYESYDQILCVSQSVKESFQKKFFCSEKLIVQYNPVDSCDILSKSKDSIDIEIQKDQLVLGTVGRLEEQKGYLRLIECAKKLRDKGYKFMIWIIGEGSQRNILEEKIRQFDLENSVKLIGFQINPYKYISKCDAFICSSYAEGFSTAATESLILGKPILTVDCAGMKELFGDCRCGEIVANNDDSLFHLLEDVINKKIDLNIYHTDILKRQGDFNIKTRIKEIEELLK